MTIKFDPDIDLEIKQVQSEFSKVGADGHTLFVKLRDLLTLQGERMFEEEIKDHPHGLEIANLGKSDVDDGRIKSWLINQFGEENFILMPTNASGKYKDHWNWIYFRQKDQAMLFKLTWL